MKASYTDAYYIDPQNGSDRNPGTKNFPFKTIQKGIDLAGENDNDGNKVYLKSGTYNLTHPLEFNRYNGKDGAYLTLQPAPGSKAILDGKQISRQASLIDIRNVRRINIVGLEISNAPTHGIEVVNGKYINIVDNVVRDAQGMGIRVRGYMAENKQYEGDTSKQSSHVVIEGNEIYRTNLSNSGINKEKNNWGAGIQAWNAEEITIVDNVVRQNYGEGIGLSLVDNGAIADNTLYDNFSQQIYLDNATDSLVKNNFIYNTGDKKFYRQFASDPRPANGIAFANEVHNINNPTRFYLNGNAIERNVIVGANSGIIYGTWAGKHQDKFTNNWQGIKNTTITHNTIYDTKSKAIRFYKDEKNRNVKIANNIFYQQSNYEISEIDGLTGLNFQRNLWYGGDAGDGSSQTDIVGNPLFVNPGGKTIGDYQLKPNSSAIDRVTYGNKDLGALELIKTAAIPLESTSNNNAETNREIRGNAGNNNITLGSGDRVFGLAGNDNFYVTQGGNNQIMGNHGEDRFWIANGKIPEAVNYINDFSAGKDKIAIAELGVTYRDLTISQITSGALISADGNDLAVVTNAPASFLANPNNFIFA